MQGDLADTARGVGTIRGAEWTDVDDALPRIERGEYGRCEVDGEDIDVERLEALPTAHTCAAHARRLDRRETPRL